MKNKKLVLFLIISLGAIIYFLKGNDWQSFPQPAVGNQPKIDASAAVVMELGTPEPQMLFKKHAQKPVPVASLIKLLVAYTVFDTVNQGEITWEDQCFLSDYGWAITMDADLSNVPMDYSESYTVAELLEGMLVASGNNCAITLAERISGSEEAFLEKMEGYLVDWGIEDYQLVNVTGLDADSLPEAYRHSKKMNKFSAQDMGIIASKLVSDFPSVLAITEQPTSVFAGSVIYNYNQLLPGEPFFYEGVTGLKTGTTKSAGACLISTCSKNQREVLTVVLGAKSDEGRYLDTQTLLDAAFAETDTE